MITFNFKREKHLEKVCVKERMALLEKTQGVLLKLEEKVKKAFDEIDEQTKQTKK